MQGREADAEHPGSTSFRATAQLMLVSSHIPKLRAERRGLPGIQPHLEEEKSLARVVRVPGLWESGQPNKSDGFYSINSHQMFELWITIKS